MSKAKVCLDQGKKQQNNQTTLYLSWTLVKSQELEFPSSQHPASPITPSPLTALAALHLNIWHQWAMGGRRQGPGFQSIHKSGLHHPETCGLRQVLDEHFDSVVNLLIFQRLAQLAPLPHLHGKPPDFVLQPAFVHVLQVQVVPVHHFRKVTELHGF